MSNNKATKETLHHVVTVLFYMIATFKHYIMKNVTTDVGKNKSVNYKQPHQYDTVTPLHDISVKLKSLQFDNRDSSGSTQLSRFCSRHESISRRVSRRLFSHSSTATIQTENNMSITSQQTHYDLIFFVDFVEVRK